MHTMMHSYKLGNCVACTCTAADASHSELPECAARIHSRLFVMEF